MKKHILIECRDGSRQWIKNTSEKDVTKIKDFRKIVSYSEGHFYFTTKRWRESKESQFKITYLEDLVI
jgi:hypothetical protein